MAISKITSDAIDATGFNLDSNTLTVDATNNRVGISTNSPSSPLEVSRSDAGIIQYITNTGSAQAYTAYGNSDNPPWSQDFNTAGGLLVGVDSDETGVVFQGGNKALRFGTNASERMRILAGGGLTFNGDTADANALDDYEEGTWTPTYSMSGASFNMSLQLGAYVKVGRMVNAVARVRGQRVGGSGILAVSGLPFTTNTTANLQPAGSIGFTNGWSNSPKGVIAGANSTLLSFKKSGSSNALSNIVDDIAGSDVSTSSTSSNDIILSITYMTS